MQETGIDKTKREDRLVIRVAQGSLAFAYRQAGGKGFEFVPYTTKNGISIAANLREALKDDALQLGNWHKALVLIDSPVAMVPIDEYDERNKEVLYNFSITGQESSSVLATILPTVNAVALYSLNKDLKLVLTDNFADIKIHPVCASVWQHLQRRSTAGTADKLFCYFHDGKVEVCSFRKSRFRFANTFAASSVNDVAYYVLAAWQQLGMNAAKDEIYLLGDYPNYDKVTDMLHNYVDNVYRIKASVEFNRNPLTQISGLPFDLATTLLR